MTDFQDLDILSLINDRPGWEIGMQDGEDLDIPGEADQENQIHNCFANDESLKSQSYSNFDMDDFSINEQHDNGDATDEYGNNSDKSNNSESDNESVKNSSAEEEVNDFDVVKNEVSYTSDEEAEDSDENDKVDRNNSDEEMEGSGDDNIGLDEGEEVDYDEEEEVGSDTDDDKSITSKGSIDEIEEQHNKPVHFSDASDNDGDILESDNENVKEESDKEDTEEEKEEDNDEYDTEDVIVVQLSDVSNDESEKDQLSEDEEGNSGLADQNDAGGNDDDGSINSTAGTNFNNIEAGNEMDENENDKLSDVSIDDRVSEQESEDDGDARGEEDDKISIDEDLDKDGDAEWSDAEEMDKMNDDNKIMRIKTVKDAEIVDINNEDSNTSLNGDSIDDNTGHLDKESGKESDVKTKKDIAAIEETESPFGFVIGDVVGVSQEEFDRQDSSIVSVTRENLSKQEDSMETVEKDEDSQVDGNRNNSKTRKEEYNTAPMEVELTSPSVYPRVESYHSDNYLFGNAPIKQEPMDDDDYIQEHDYFGQTSTMGMDDQSFSELGTDELGLEAGELLTYQDMFDITATGQYKCKYCSAKLGTFKGLKIHIDKCHQKSYKCQECDEVFTRSQDLAGHCRIHRKEERISNEVKSKKGGKIIYQPLCKPRPSRGKNVIVEKDGRRLYRCRFCNKKFDMTQKLANHMQWKHKKERQREQKLKASLDGKHTVTQVSLYGAKMTIKVESASKDGSQRKPPVYSDTYQCAQCPQIFNKQQAMAVHVRNHHSKQLKTDQQKNKETSHLGLKNRKKTSKQKLRTISEDRKMKEENSFSGTNSNLEADVTPVKQAKLAMVCPSLKCKLCSKTFQEARELKSHLNGVHAQYCCRYCPKSFYKVEKFMCHSFQHLGDLKYFVEANAEPMIYCRKCKATLPVKTDVTLKHVIGHIKGRNPSGHSLSLERQVFLECSDCGQPFISREFLFKHEMKHAVSSGRVNNMKSCARSTTDSSAPASVSADATTTVRTGATTSELCTSKYTVSSAPIVTSGTPVTTRSEMVAHHVTDQTKFTTGGENTKGDDIKKVLIRSTVLHTELISLNTIPFKCGMCDARFPNSQYLLHHMTLHMNGQYVFKIEVDKKKEELSKGSENFETMPEDISSSNTTETPVTTQPSSGNQMASSIKQQLSKGSNMASIISSNISPEGEDLFNPNDNNGDHTYTSRQPLIDSNADKAVSKTSTNTTKTTSRGYPSTLKQFIILPSKSDNANVVWSTPTPVTDPNIRTTTVTPDVTKKLQEMLTKKEQTVTNSDAEIIKIPKVVKIPTLRPIQGKDFGVRMVVEKKIRELLDVHKVPPAKVPPSSRGVQTKYTSLIYPKKAIIQKSVSSTSDATASFSQNALVQTVNTTTSETVQSKNSVLSFGSNVSTTVLKRSESTDIPAAEPASAQYSDTETLSATSESPGQCSPRSISPVVGISSESDSDDLSEDEQALFEETTVPVYMPIEKQETENASSAGEVKKEAEPHSPTPLPKVGIKNYKNQLDFAQGSWFECELCMYLCKTYKEFKNHLSGHKSSKKTKLVKCSLCSRKFISKWHRAKHNETHRANAYSCSKCGTNFRTSVSVMKHMAEECTK